MFAAVNTVEPPILEIVTAKIIEGKKPWSAERLPLVMGRIRERLRQLAARLGEAEWLDGAFSAGDLMMVSVLLRSRASGLLDEFPTLAASDPERHWSLSRRLAGIDAIYDVIVFDAPPSMGLVNINILLAAEEVVIPVGTTYLALDGCAEMVTTVEQASKQHSRGGLRVSLVVPTLYRKTALADEILAKLRHYFPDRCAEPLAMNVAIDEAQSHGKTIWDHAPWSRGATLMQTIADDIWARRPDAALSKSA